MTRRRIVSAFAAGITGAGVLVITVWPAAVGASTCTHDASKAVATGTATSTIAGPPPVLFAAPLNALEDVTSNQTGVGQNTQAAHADTDTLAGTAQVDNIDLASTATVDANGTSEDESSVRTGAVHLVADGAGWLITATATKVEMNSTVTDAATGYPDAAVEVDGLTVDGVDKGTVTSGDGYQIYSTDPATGQSDFLSISVDENITLIHSPGLGESYRAATSTEALRAVGTYKGQQINVTVGYASVDASIPPAPACASGTVSPSTTDFGNSTVGQTGTQHTITIASDGFTALTVANARISGPDAADFSISDDQCSGHTIPVGGSCAVEVIFKPTAAGSRTATLSFTDDASDSPQTASLAGTGILDNDLSIGPAPADQTLNATSPSGAVVTYSAPTAADGSDPAPAVSCDHPSGSRLPIGTTTVTCSATDPDDANSPVSASFTVTIRGAQAQAQDLLTYVDALPPGTSLTNKTQALMSYIVAGDRADECTMIRSIIGEAKAQSGKHLTATQAAAVIARATQIGAVLGC